jgi:hypothetical protein
MPFDRGELLVFNYLWADQAGRGEESGRKPRRCVVIPLVDRSQLLILAISSTQTGDAARLAFPELEARRLGFSSNSAVVVGEANLVNDDNLVDFVSLVPLGKLSPSFTKAVAQAIAIRWRDDALTRIERI